jgi:hypothetical protein
MTADSDLIQALRPVLAEFERHGISYCVGGSVASSFYGAARSTLDVDLAAELDETSVLRLVESLSNDYYVSKTAAIDALRHKSCFNMLHANTSFKVDVFISRLRPFDRSVQKRSAVQMLGDTEQLPARVASSEDILLIKLEWFRLGNEVSERQWSDVLQVARLQAQRLDRAYLELWASELGVTDLLHRLFQETDASGSK